MKRSYQKPRIYVESFELAQSIARNCDVDPSDASTVGRPTHNDPGVRNCGWDMGNNLIFFVAESACTKIEDPNDFYWGSICYNAPQGETQIFASA